MPIRRLCLMLLPALLLAVPTPARPQQPARPQGVSPAVQQVLDDIRKADTGMLAVSPQDGEFLRLLVVTSGARRALEIGAASGYSAIWIGLGLRETGGRLTTIEYDPVRAKEARANIARAGLSDIVEVIAGDAFKAIPRLEGPFDFVFLDAWKRDYQRFFDLVFPRMPKGSLFVAHNVLNKREEMGDFLATIHRHPDLFTSIVAPSGEGVSVSWKRR
ncbi:MAG TPA: O-methyltransferase [Vicinamibacterales bacterium]